MNAHQWDITRKHLDKIGLCNINDKVLEYIESGNKKKIKEYCENNIPCINYNPYNKYCSVIHEGTRYYFTYVDYITSGSYSHVCKWYTESNINIPYGKTLVSKRVKEEGIKDLEISFVDAFIHSVLYIYQTIMLKKLVKFIVPIRLVTYDKRRNKLVIFLDYIDHNIYEILSVKNTSLDIHKKIELAIDTYYQLSCTLELLQEKLKFVHYDLKGNNIYIFNEKKINSVLLSDFGSSRLVIMDYVISGEEFFDLSSCFTETRDMYHLIHSTTVFCGPESVYNYLIKFIDRVGGSTEQHVQSVIKEGDGWQDIYKHNFFDDRYKPKNVQNLIKTLYPYRY
jgi:hypothetical protein